MFIIFPLCFNRSEDRAPLETIEQFKSFHRQSIEINFSLGYPRSCSIGIGDLLWRAGSAWILIDFEFE